MMPSEGAPTMLLARYAPISNTPPQGAWVGALHMETTTKAAPSEGRAGKCFGEVVCHLLLGGDILQVNEAGFRVLAHPSEAASHVTSAREEDLIFGQSDGALVVHVDGGWTGELHL